MNPGGADQESTPEATNEPGPPGIDADHFAVSGGSGGNNQHGIFPVGSLHVLPHGMTEQLHLSPENVEVIDPRFRHYLHSYLLRIPYALRRRMLTLFGSVAVTIMFLSYWVESRSKWMVLVFAAGSAATALYSALSAVYPITVIEGLWTLVAVQRFWKLHQQSIASQLD